MIEARNLVRRYGYRTILRDLNFTAAPGEFVALLGPNGAGKTTLLRVFAGLLRPTGGVVTVAGCLLPHQAMDLRSRLGVVSHQPLLYGDLTAAENLRFYGQLYGVAHLAARIEALLALTGLEAVRNDLVRTFSRGMVQRLAVARAILHRPGLLLLDEPFEGLAPAVILELFRVFDRLRQHISIVIVEHNLDLVLALADRVFALERGAVFQQGPAAPLLTDLDYRKKILWL